VAAASHGSEDGHYPAHLVAAVGVEGFAVAGGDVACLLLLLTHDSISDNKPYNTC
jgi:hypothetical protein